MPQNYEHPDPTVRATDKSPDNANFMLIPRIVWARCEDPYQLSLWQAIKDIAGEKGECFLSTPQLAEYSMMSAGMVTKCRQALMDKGLIEGQIVRDPGQFNAVWHLSIPNLWGENATWAALYPTIRHRMRWKSEQQAQRKALSCGESAQKTGGARSCGERPPSPHERPPSPHETIKDLNKDLQKIESIEQLELAALSGGISRMEWQKLERVLDGAVCLDRAEGLQITGLGDQAEILQERLGRTFTNILMRPVQFTE